MAILIDSIVHIIINKNKLPYFFYMILLVLGELIPLTSYQLDEFNLLKYVCLVNFFLI